MAKAKIKMEVTSRQVITSGETDLHERKYLSSYSSLNGEAPQAVAISVQSQQQDGTYREVALLKKEKEKVSLLFGGMPDTAQMLEIAGDTFSILETVLQHTGEE